MAYTQWESRNIDKKKNIIEFRGTGDKPTGNYIGENSTLLDYESGSEFYWKDGTWKPLKESSSGGSSGGEGLPADFPAEGSENANKFLGFDANGDYTAKDAPSFVVTLEQDETTGEQVSDKTFSDTYSAYMNKKYCIFIAETLGAFTLISAAVVENVYYMVLVDIGGLLSGESGLRLLQGNGEDYIRFS